MSQNTVTALKRRQKPNQDFTDSIAEAVAQRLDPSYPRKQVTITFGQMFERWLNDYAKAHYQERSWRNYERAFRSYFTYWKDSTAYEIRRSDVQGWLTRLKDTKSGTTANRQRELMRMVYNFAISVELIPDNYNPAAGTGKACGIRKFKTVKRERFLQADELPRFFAALETLRYENARDCLAMCLFTAQRVGNVRKMRWDGIDLGRAVWSIPAEEKYGVEVVRMKNGIAHVVALTPDAVAILKRRAKTRKSDWVFPARLDSTRPMEIPDNAWRALCAKAGIENLRIHDLRRSHASWQAITGANISMIAKTLNHQDLNSTAIYARLNVDDQRKAMEIANKAILQAAGLNSTPQTVEQSAKPPALKTPGFAITTGEWVTEEEAAEAVGLSMSRLAQLRTYGSGPAFMRAGGTIKYDLAALQAWFHKRQETGRKVNASRASSEDRELLDEFLAKNTILGADLLVEAKELYEAYVDWTERRGSKAIKKNMFGRCMSLIGFRERQLKGKEAHYLYKGLALIDGAL